MAFTLGEYKDIFLEEADEQLQELNKNLLELEKNYDNIDTINNIFRTAHSLKSSAAFVGLNDLSDLSHEMENLLQGIRDRTMEITPEIIDILFQCFDVINSVIETVAGDEEPSQDVSKIIGIIKKIAKKAENDIVQKSEQEVAKLQKVDLKTSFTAEDRKFLKKGLEEGKSCCEVVVFFDPSAPMKWIKVQLIINSLEQIGDILKMNPSLDELNTDWEDDIFGIVFLTDQPLDDVRSACDIDLVLRIDLRRISLTKKNDKFVLKFHQRETLIEEISDEIKDEGTMSVNENQKGALVDIEESANEVQDSSENQDKVEDKKKDDKKSHIIKSVKVSVDKLDLLLNTVGELVIANSGFFKLYEEMSKFEVNKILIDEFKSRMEQMSHIAKDLQSGIMNIRMVPIGQVFTRFNRLVRDLSKEFDKNIILEVSGEDTELDKKVVDTIGEPLIHLMRNSVDHGIETPEERKEFGKLETAVISLNAFQGGNQIFVEVSDDGRGLNVEKIKEKVIERKLVTTEVISNMEDDDIFDFIFTAGFSTADVVTDISGRGVGMNVVKEIINELNGSITIETEQGVGTKFILAFPLTLAIIPAIMVKVCNEMYAIPLSDVIETIKISPSDISSIEGHEAINLRGDILSLLRLNEFVGIKSSLKKDQRIPVVVVGYGNRKIGIIVDFLEGKQEIVIKSLDENYTVIGGLSGASILGDGSICLILDVSSMINKVIADEERLSKQKVYDVVNFDNSEIDEKYDYRSDGQSERKSTIIFKDRDEEDRGISGEEDDIEDVKEIDGVEEVEEGLEDEEDRGISGEEDDIEDVKEIDGVEEVEEG